MLLADTNRGLLLLEIGVVALLHRDAAVVTMLAYTGGKGTHRHYADS